MGSGRAQGGRPRRRYLARGGAPGGGHLSSGLARRPPLRAVLFDLDGTLTRPRSSWQFVHERLGLWSGRSDRHQERFRAGEISYEEFCRLDAAEWRGTSLARIQEICDAIPFHDGAADLISALKARRMRIGIVSTGLSLLADRVRNGLDLDHAIANDVVVRGGELTGEAIVKVAHGRKDAALARFCEAFDLPAREVAAVGDTEGDISMFRAAGWSIAFNPADAEVEAAASAVASGTDLRGLISMLLSEGG